MAHKNEQQHPAAPKAEHSVTGAVRRSGRPCKNCGSTERWACNRSCVECDRRTSRDRNRVIREDRFTYYQTLLDNRRRGALKRKEQRGQA